MRTEGHPSFANQKKGKQMLKYATFEGIHENNREHTRNLGRIIDLMERQPIEVRIIGMLYGKRVSHISALTSTSIISTRRFSSALARLFGECGAEYGYTQGGQCKTCSRDHQPPSFETYGRDHDRLLELFEKDGWEWKWQENSKRKGRLLLTHEKDRLTIYGALRKELVLAIAGVFIFCPPSQRHHVGIISRP